VTRPLLAVVVGIAIWVILLPALVVRDATGGLTPPWRPIPLVLLGAVLAAVGVWLVWSAVVRLEAAGVAPFGVHPGPELITDGLYGRVRNPMDLGNTLLSVAPLAAVDVASMWIVPLAAFTYYLIGQEPLEHHYLRQRFGSEWEDYRASVPVWTPLWR
jgi:protein-S-isoprenylcysteine O-methyltransferase Ste14